MDKKLLKFISKHINSYTKGNQTKDSLNKTAKEIIMTVRMDLAHKLKKGKYL